MKTLPRSAGLAILIGLVFTFKAGAVSIPDYKVNDEEAGQEFQHDVVCCAHADGRWTAAWLDYRMGAPGIFVRSYRSDDTPAGPSQAVTDGYGLFTIDLNASSVGQPAIASLGDGRSAVAWAEVRGEDNLIRAAVVDSSGIVVAPVTVNDTSRRSSTRFPHLAIAGDHILVVWAEAAGAFARVFGQVLDLDLTPVGDNDPLHPELEVPQDAPVVVARGNGWLVAWEEGEERPQAMLRAFGPDGTADTGVVNLDSDPTQAQREIAVLPVSGGFFMSWTSTEQSQVGLKGRMVDSNLAPLGEPFDVYTPDPQTITPRGPVAIPGSGGAVLVFWPAGPAAHTRIFSRRILLPGTPAGGVQILEDPPDPVGGVLIPHSLAGCGGDGVQRRVAWWDNREGWDLAYCMRVDDAGGAIEGSLLALDLADGTASQVLPATAIFPDGRGIVVWEDFRTGGMSIFGRTLDRDGVPQDVSFRVSEASIGSISYPATNLRDLLRNRPSVATTTGGYAAAAWTAFLPDGRSRIYLQSYDPTGARLGGNVGFPTFAGQLNPNTQTTPTIVPLASGGLMIVWKDLYTDSQGDIYARRFLADGTADGDTIRIVDPGAYAGASQDAPVAASSGSGEVVVAWIDGRTSDGDVYAQRLGPTGRRIERNRQISPKEELRPILQRNPAIAAAPGRYAIVWDQDPLGAGVVLGNLTILPSQKTGSSFSVDIPIRINTGFPGMKYPRVAMNPDGRFIVTYWDTESDSARVMAQRFDPEARPIGPPYALADIGGRALAIPGGVAANVNRIQYAFSDARDMRGWDVRVRRVDWTFDGWYSAIAIASWAVEETDDALVLRWSVPLDRAGGLYSIWRAPNEADDAGGSPGRQATLLASPIGPLASGGAEYAFHDATAEPGRRFAYWIEDADGEFAGPWSGARGLSPAVASLRALGNPFRASIRLAWSAPGGAGVEITVHDAAGRRVRAWRGADAGSAGGATAGRGETIWDGRDDTGRPVPAGAYWARLRAPSGVGRSVQLLRLR